MTSEDLDDNNGVINNVGQFSQVDFNTFNSYLRIVSSDIQDRKFIYKQYTKISLIC